MASAPIWLKSYPSDVDWAAPIPVHPIAKLLDDSVARYGDRPSLAFLGKRYSFRDVGDLVDRVARGLQLAGLKKGDRIGLFLPNCPYFVIFYYAVLKAGGTVVNFNPLYADAELRHQIADAGIETMVTLDLAALYPKLGKLLGSTGLKRVVVCPMAGCLPFWMSLGFRLFKRGEIADIPNDAAHVRFAELTANDGRVVPVVIDPLRDVAVLQYTGGTTGVPKGAALTHANVVANTHQAKLWFPKFEPGRERALAVLPFFHVFAMTSAMNFSIAAGAEIVMLPRFDLVTVLQTISRERPTFFPGVPTIFTAINARTDLAKYDLSSIKFCISGGASLPVEVKATFEKLSGCTVVEGYGLSETSPIALCNPLSGVNKPGSIGIPVPGTMVEIISLDDEHRPMPVGERGEIVISGPQVMAGYWQKPAETEAVLKDGKLRTGDVGYIDEDGYVFLVDRIKDVILAGGYKIYPRNVEEAIYQHPAVAECIVLGIPDPYRGQTVKAFIVRRPGQSLDGEGVLNFLKDKISPIEMPKLIEFRDSLPKTVIGKLSKKMLADEEASKASPV